MMEKNARIYLAGHSGLVGSALRRRLTSEGYTNLILRDFSELDLRNQGAVEVFFAAEQPEYLFLAAAKVGGILANSTLPAEFIYDNLMIEANLINAAYQHGVKKLLFLGSSCIYPKHAPQPMKEEYLLTGELEPTNEAYAVAKIAGIKLCQYYNQQYGTRFIAVMPTNLYGPNDNFDLESSHVLPALIRKFHDAKMAGSPQVTIWGTGTPVREFLHVDDMAAASVFLMNNYDGAGIVNIGCGEGITIKDLALLIRDVVGYGGEIVHDTTKPDGMMIKINDVSRLKSLGWSPRYTLREGIVKTYEWFRETVDRR